MLVSDETVFTLAVAALFLRRYFKRRHQTHYNDTRNTDLRIR